MFAGADSTHVLDLVIRNTERMVVLPTPPLYMECSERELSFAILDVAAALSRPDLAIAMRPLLRFTGLINELQAVLPPERWTGAEIEPRIGSMRSYTWGDQISDAGIDIDIVPQWSPDEEISYVVTIFGWIAISPQL